MNKTPSQATMSSQVKTGDRRSMEAGAPKRLVPPISTPSRRGIDGTDSSMGLPQLVDPYSNEDDTTTKSEKCYLSSMSPLLSNDPSILTRAPLSNRSPVGIAAYIQDELTNNSEIRPRTTPSAPQAAVQSKATCSKNRKRPTAPWYCVSRPISKQTKDTKLRSVNRSSSIHFSRILEKCRSILEFCTLWGDVAECNETSIQDMHHNHDWGDWIPANVKGQTLRVVYQNVHCSVSASDNPSTDFLLNNLNQMDADIFMASETNVNWKSATFRNNFQQKVRNIWPASRVAYSSSNVGLEFEYSEFLPGDTCTMVMDNLSMRVIKVSEDESRLSRWSYVTLEGQNGRKVTFITAYRVCRGAMKGTNTSSLQQQKVIHKQEMRQGVQTSSIDTTYLREKFITDLLLFIESLKEAGHAIVLGFDANETPEESLKAGAPKPGSVSWLLEQSGLKEIFVS